MNFKKSTKVFTWSFLVAGLFMFGTLGVQATCDCTSVPIALFDMVTPPPDNIGACGGSATMVVKLHAICNECLVNSKTGIIDSAGGFIRSLYVDHTANWPMEIETYWGGGVNHGIRLYAFTQTINSPTIMWANGRFIRNGCHCCADAGNEDHCPAWTLSSPSYTNGAICYVNVDIGTLSKIVSCGSSTTPFLSLAAGSNAVNAGEAVSLSWGTANVDDHCLATNGWSGSKNIVGGSESVTPMVTTTYSLECWDSAGVSTGQKSTTVTVFNSVNPELAFSAAPNPISLGSSSVLSWGTINVDNNCLASGGWSGPKNKISGSEIVTPAVTTTYYLECFHSPGISTGKKDVTVVVVNAAEPALSFSASSTTINAGNSTILNWNPINVDDHCTATEGWSGNKIITGGTETVSPVVTTTYTLECWNLGGVSTGIKSVVVTVNSCVPNYQCSHLPTGAECSGDSCEETINVSTGACFETNCSGVPVPAPISNCASDCAVLTENCPDCINYRETIL